jgi:sulfate adenylyltransferase
MSKTLIRPHGGSLIARRALGGDRERAAERAAALPAVTLGERSLHDLECIATGVYSPLEGFVGEEDYHAIVHDMRLSNGLAWSIPISLQVSDEVAQHLPLDGEIALAHPDGTRLAVMTVTDKFRPDQLREAEKVYGTDDDAHPGVAAMRSAGEIYLGGPVTLIADLPADAFPEYAMTPHQTRAAFAERDWDTVVAFQTRNPIHRAHEYLTKCALEMVDGLFINPLIGTTKSDDIPADVRMRCYLVLLERYYPDERVVLGTYPAAMRYAGPREAILHAISRQNYGCTHFIVGRDHAGVGNYYGTYDAQDIFNEYRGDELAITPLKFEHAFFDTRSQQMATAKTSSSTPDHPRRGGPDLGRRLPGGVR